MQSAEFTKQVLGPLVEDSRQHQTHLNHQVPSPAITDGGHAALAQSEPLA